ncbi:MAG TPA: hypothetical protein VF056_05490 [Thermoleophilaceae bacterium]
MGDAAEDSLAVRESRDMVALAGENVDALHPERSRGHIAAAGEVSQDSVDALIDACDWAVARHRPDDLARQ